MYYQFHWTDPLIRFDPKSNILPFFLISFYLTQFLAIRVRSIMFIEIKLYFKKKRAK